MIVKIFTEELLKPVGKLCRQSMELDRIPDFLLKEKIFDEPDFDPQLILTAFEKEDAQPIAFIQGVVKNRGTEKVGYIKLLCVDSNFRRKGVATKLYNSIEEKFRESGVKKVRVYESYPNYFMPGVDPFYTEAVCFFKRNGFKKFNDTSNLTADLVSQDFRTGDEEDKFLREGIICRRAKLKDKEKVLSFIKEKFPAWEYEVLEAFKNNPVTLFLAEVDGEVKAFSAHEANNRGTGWFGPMGTDDSLRGKGIGGILFKNV